mgnify:CR=1 FL=1
MSDKSTDLFLERIATALERIAPPEKKINNLNQGEGFVFDSKTGLLRPVEEINRIPLSLLQGIKHQKEILLKNTFSDRIPKSIKNRKDKIWEKLHLENEQLAKEL